MNLSSFNPKYPRSSLGHENMLVNVIDHCNRGVAQHRMDLIFVANSTRRDHEQRSLGWDDVANLSKPARRPKGKPTRDGFQDTMPI